MMKLLLQTNRAIGKRFTAHLYDKKKQHDFFKNQLSG